VLDFPDALAAAALESLDMLSKELLDILVCPDCKKPLQLKPAGDALKCTGCHRVYPIRDEIPILLVDESHIEQS